MSSAIPLQVSGAESTRGSYLLPTADSEWPPAEVQKHVQHPSDYPRISVATSIAAVPEPVRGPEERGRGAD
jgi:hypothetical protein